MRRCLQTAVQYHHQEFLTFCKEPVYAAFVWIYSSRYNQGVLHDRASSSLDSFAATFYKPDFDLHNNLDHAHASLYARWLFGHSGITDGCKISVVDYGQQQINSDSAYNVFFDFP